MKVRKHKRPNKHKCHFTEHNINKEIDKCFVNSFELFLKEYPFTSYQLDQRYIICFDPATGESIQTKG